jgi:phage tail-like protein
MRGILDDLQSPIGTVDRLPGLYQEDGLAARLCGALDCGLAPVVVTLDNFPAYLDPATTPDDMLGWLAEWVGLSLVAGHSVQRQRELVAAGVELLRWRGTVRGVRDSIRLVAELEPEVSESGGTEWSAQPGRALPGREGAELVVRITVDDPEAVDIDGIDELIAAVKPAHVSHRLQVVTAAQTA